MEDVKIINVRGHYEVFINGNFAFSADNYTEIMEELAQDNINI